MNHLERRSKFSFDIFKNMFQNGRLCHHNKFIHLDGFKSASGSKVPINNVLFYILVGIRIRGIEVQ